MATRRVLVLDVIAVTPDETSLLSDHHGRAPPRDDDHDRDDIDDDDEFVRASSSFRGYDHDDGIDRMGKVTIPPFGEGMGHLIFSNAGFGEPPQRGEHNTRTHIFWGEMRGIEVYNDEHTYIFKRSIEHK